VTDLVNAIEQNEKQNETIPDKLAEQAGQLLSFKKEYYDMKKELLLYSQFSQI
jgi:WD40 repeat protein